MANSPELDSTIGIPMHFEAGGIHSEIPPQPPTVEYDSLIKVPEVNSGTVALTGSEISVKPVPIANLRDAFEREDALRRAS